MSVSKTGWIIAAATAAAFAAGCAGQSHNDNVGGASCAGEPAVAATHACKGMSECKSKADNNNKVVKHHRHHAKKVMMKDDNNGKVEKTEKTEEETTTKEENTEAK